MSTSTAPAATTMTSTAPMSVPATVQSRSPSPKRSSNVLTAFSEFHPLSAHDLAVLDHYQADAADLLAVRAHLVALDAQVRTLRSQVLLLVDADLAKFHAAAVRIQAAWRGSRTRQAVRQRHPLAVIRSPAAAAAASKSSHAPSSRDADLEQARASTAALAARLAPIESGFADLATTVDQLASKFSAYIASSAAAVPADAPPKSPTAASFRSMTPRPASPLGSGAQNDRVSKQDLERLHQQVAHQEAQVTKLRATLAKVLADNARMRGVVRNAAARTIQAKWKSTRLRPAVTHPHTPPPASPPAIPSSTVSVSARPRVLADLTLDATPSTPAAPVRAAPVSPSPLRPRIRQPVFDPHTPPAAAAAHVGDLSMLSEAEESFLDQVSKHTLRRGSSSLRSRGMLSPRNIMGGGDSDVDEVDDVAQEGKWVSVDDFNYMRAEVELLRAQLDGLVATLGRRSPGADTARLDAMESGARAAAAAASPPGEYIAQPQAHVAGSGVAAQLRASVSSEPRTPLPGSLEEDAMPVQPPASAPPATTVPMGATLVGPVAFYDF